MQWLTVNLIRLRPSGAKAHIVSPQSGGILLPVQAWRAPQQFEMMLIQGCHDPFEYTSQ